MQYIPWDVDRKPVPTDARVESDIEEEHPNLQRDSRQHEWEIICGIYKNQFINYNEFEMLGHRDLDRMNDWNTAFVNEETSSRAIHFISDMRKLKTISTNQHAKSYSIDSLGDKQRIAYNVILEHYRTGVDPLRMIIQGTAGTRNSYLIGAIKNTLENISHPGKSPLLLLAPIGVELSTYLQQQFIMHFIYRSKLLILYEDRV